MIARVIHQIWIGPDKPESLGWDSWQDFDYNLVTDVEAERDYGVDTSMHPRFVSNLIRYKLLQRYGGIYADFDISPVASFDEVLDNNLVLFRHGYRPEVSTSLMLAAKQSPFFDSALRAVENRPCPKQAYDVPATNGTTFLTGFVDHNGIEDGVLLNFGLVALPPEGAVLAMEMPHSKT